MTRTRPLFALPLLLAGLAAAPAARAAPDREEARDDLGKNAGRLEQASAKLAELKEALDVTNYKDEAKVGRLEEQIRQVRGVTMELVGKVAAADSEKAAQVLVTFGVIERDHEVYEKIFAEVSRLGDEGAIEWMAETLEGERRRIPAEPWKARALCAQAFRDVYHEAAAGALAKVIRDGRNTNVVNACIRSARGKEDRRIVGALIELLGRVEDQGGWEYYEARSVLTELTGRDYFTYEKWSNWWSPKRDTYDFEEERGDATRTRTRERGPEEEPPTFFGSEIESNRICFVIDTSGSMKMTDRPDDWEGSKEDFRRANPDGERIEQYKRIERAKTQTIQAIKGLQPTQKFNVIGFSNLRNVWEERVVPANGRNKQDAIEFVQGLQADGGTYTDDALKRAFEDPLVDTIYLLSDGAPYKKVGTPPKNQPDPNQPVSSEEQRLFCQQLIDDIYGWVRYANRFRSVKIYTFGMDGPGTWHKKWPQPRPVTLPTDAQWLSVLENFMRKLARITGGEFKSI